MQQQTRTIRRRRTIALAAVAAMAASTTAACASGTGAKAAPASKELVYWSMWQQTEPQAKVIQKALTSFGQTTGIKVTIQWKGRTVLKDMATALKAGQPAPDLVDGSINTITADLVAPGQALDLTPLYSQPVTGENSLLSDVVPDKYMPLLSDANNRAVLVPYEVASEAFFFDKARQPQLAGGGKPQTWDQFVNALASIKSAGKVAPLALDPITGNCAYWTEWVLERELGPGQMKKMAEERTSALPSGTSSRWDDQKAQLLDGASKIEALV